MNLPNFEEIFKGLKIEMGIILDENRLKNALSLELDSEVIDIIKQHTDKIGLICSISQEVKKSDYLYNLSNSEPSFEEFKSAKIIIGRMCRPSNEAHTL